PPIAAHGGSRPPRYSRTGGWSYCGQKRADMGVGRRVRPPRGPISHPERRRSTWFRGDRTVHMAKLPTSTRADSKPTESSCGGRYGILTNQRRDPCVPTALLASSWFAAIISARLAVDTSEQEGVLQESPGVQYVRLFGSDLTNP